MGRYGWARGWWLLGAIGPACATSTAGPGARPAVVMVCPEGQVATRQGGCKPGEGGAAVVPALTRPAIEPYRPANRLGGSELDALRGSWRGEDSDGSAFFELTISSDDHFVQTITTLHTNTGRSQGICEQEGTVRLEGDQLIWVFSRNTCNTDYEGREDADTLAEQGPRHFLLKMDSYQVDYTRQR